MLAPKQFFILDTFWLTYASYSSLQGMLCLEFSMSFYISPPPKRFLSTFFLFDSTKELWVRLKSRTILLTPEPYLHPHSDVVLFDTRVWRHHTWSVGMSYRRLGSRNTCAWFKISLTVVTLFTHDITWKWGLSIILLERQVKWQYPKSQNIWVFGDVIFYSLALKV